MKKTKIAETGAQDEVSNSEKTALNLYLKEINEIPLLSRAEEERIAELAVKGNKAAQQKLVNANLRFVISVAKKYQGRGLPLEDLISEGNIGLMSAISNFDSEKGYRFITYAVWWIRQSIVKAINEKGRIIRLPCNKANELRRIERMIQEGADLSSIVGVQEIASSMKISQGRAEELLLMSQDAISLEEPAMRNDDSPTSPTIQDMIVDENANDPCEYALNSVLRDQLNKAVDCLEKKAAQVIRGRFGLNDDSAPLTLQEIGTLHNLSRERVRQIEKVAINRLHDFSQKMNLESLVM